MRIIVRGMRKLFCVVVVAVAFSVHAAAQTDRTVLQKFNPEYSGLARQMHLQGTVVLMIEIGPDGQVQNVSVQHGHPVLAAASVEAVRRWKYAPGFEKTLTSVTFNFNVP